MGSMELVLSLPRDERYAETAAAVAAHAARQAGHAASVADAFGRRVDARVRELLRAAGPDLLAVVVRRENGPVQVLVSGHVLTLE
jgi:hypothetical protein